MGRFGSRIVGVLVGLALIASASACVPDGPSGGAAVGAQCTSPPQIVAGASLFGCDLAGLDTQAMTGNSLAVIANRISYLFDLHGPSMTVDTACSSSLMALHQACAAIADGSIDTAIVSATESSTSTNRTSTNTIASITPKRLMQRKNAAV